MPIRRLVAFLPVTIAVALSGCAFGRDEVKLAALPPATVAALPSKGKTVFIRAVTDERVFSKSGDDPTTPSLDTDADKPEIKARAIARKRNGYEMPLGDVLLEPGQTVAGQVGDTLRQAFVQAGYTVSNQATGGPTSIAVDVRVKKFWTWHRKGFTVVTLLADIETVITIAGAKSGPALVSVHKEEETLAAGPGAAIDTLQQALAAYRAEAVTKLAELKF